MAFLGEVCRYLPPQAGDKDHERGCIDSSWEVKSHRLGARKHCLFSVLTNPTPKQTIRDYRRQINQKRPSPRESSRPLTDRVFHFQGSFQADAGGDRLLDEFIYALKLKQQQQQNKTQVGEHDKQSYNA